MHLWKKNVEITGINRKWHKLDVMNNFDLITTALFLIIVYRSLFDISILYVNYEYFQIAYCGRYLIV